MRVPEEDEAGASGRVEWIVVGSDGLVRNAEVELGCWSRLMELN